MVLIYYGGGEGGGVVDTKQLMAKVPGSLLVAEQSSLPGSPDHVPLCAVCQGLGTNIYNDLHMM